MIKYIITKYAIRLKTAFLFCLQFAYNYILLNKNNHVFKWYHTITINYSRTGLKHGGYHEKVLCHI